MNQSYIHLEWDTEFFGFGVARIMLPALGAAELSKTLAMLRDNDYHMAYWQIAVGSHDASRIAQVHGGFLADEKVTYAKLLVGASDSRMASAYTSTSLY